MCNDGNIIKMVEGTTRYVNITMVDKDGNPSHSDSDINSTCFVSFGKEKTSLDTDHEGNVISFVIPPDLTVGKSKGEFEVRVFEESVVVSIIIGKIDIIRSPNPIIEYPG